VQDGHAITPSTVSRAGKGPGLESFFVISLSPLRGEGAHRVRRGIRWSARERGFAYRRKHADAQDGLKNDRPGMVDWAEVTR